MRAKNSFPIWLKLCVFLITWFIFLVIFEIISQIWAPLLTKETSSVESLPARTFSRIFQLIGTLASIYLFTRFIDQIPFRSLGFHLKNRWKDILIGILLGFGVMLIGYAILIGLNEIFFETYTINTTAILYSILFFILVSLIEEILCRGYILHQLLETYNKYIALMISSIIFTALHSFNPNMATVPVLNLFLAGILLGITYIYTKNLWFPIALHFSWNFFQGPFFGFEVSGQAFYSIIQQTRTEDNLLNGGSFGFEGSLLATFLMLIFILLINRYYSKKTL